MDDGNETVFKEIMRGGENARYQVYTFKAGSSPEGKFGFFDAEAWCHFVCLLHVIGTSMTVVAIFGQSNKVGLEHEVTHNGTEGMDVMDALRNAAGYSSLARLRLVRVRATVKPNRQTIFLMPRFCRDTVLQCFGGAPEACNWLDASTARRAARVIDEVVAVVKDKGIEGGPRIAIVEGYWESQDIGGMVTPKVVVGALALCRSRITRAYSWTLTADDEVPQEEDWCIMVAVGEWILMLIDRTKVAYCWGYDFSLSQGFLPNDARLPKAALLNDHYLRWVSTNDSTAYQRPYSAMRNTFLYLCVEIGTANGLSMSTIHDPLPEYVGPHGAPAASVIIRKRPPASWASCAGYMPKLGGFCNLQ